MRLRSAVLAALAFALGCASDNGGVVNVLVVASVEVTPGATGVTPGNTVQLSAVPKTSTGLAIPGRTVTWASGDPGLATVSAAGLVLGVAVGGPVHIQATVDGVTGEALITVFAVPVDHVTVTPSSNPLFIGNVVQLTATAFDAAGTPLTGRSFLWQSSAPSIAEVTGGLVTALALGGPVTITATAEGKSGTATVTVTPRPATRLGFLQQPGATTAGQPIAPAVQVAIRDDLLGTVTGATNSVTIALAANPGGATLGGTATVNAVAGIATFSNLTLDKVGTGYTLLATSLGLTSATSSPFNVSAGSANLLAFITPPPAAAQSGVALTTQPVLQLRDGIGNPVAQAGVVVTATIASGTGTLSGSTTATTNSAGTASFTTLALSGLAGSYTLSFGSPGITSVTAPIALTAGPAAVLAMATQPSSSAQSGVPLAQQPAVQLRDAAGNPVPRSGVVITATIAVGTGTLGGITTATTNASGVAQFTSLAINGNSGTYALGFSSPGLAGVTSASIILGGPPATKLFIVTQPSATAQSGVAFTQQPAVQLRDASDNAVAQAGVVVTVAIATGGGTLGGTLTATTNGSGLATFTNLSITGAAGDRTLSFAAAGLTGATSGTVTVTAGSANQLAITTPPSTTAPSGVAFAQQPAIQLRDASNNPVNQAGVSITAAISSGGGTLGGTTSATTDATGTATFTNLSISGTIGQRTLLFGAATFISVASNPIDITAGPADHLTITTQPSASAQSGIAFAQQPVIQLRDAAGNAVTVSGTVVTASIASGGGTLGGTTTATTNGSGVATFTNLSITGGAGNYTLGFAAPSLTGVTSATISIASGPPASVAITTQPSTTAASGAAFAQQPVLLVKDASNSPVSNSAVTATINSGPPGASFVGTATVTTDAVGVATFSGLGLSGTVGSYTLTFTAGSVTSAASNVIALGAGAAATVVANSATSQTATVGTAVSAPPSVKVTDGQGNAVAGFAVAFAVATGGGTVTPASPSTVATDAGGVATATSWVLGPTAGTNNNSVTATASGLGGSPVTFTASATAGAAAQLTFSTQPSTSAQNGAAFAQQPVLLVQDAGNNPVSGVVVTATITGAPAGASLVGTTTATSNGSGLAAFTNLGLSGPLGNYTLSFIAGALNSGPSNTIALAAGAASKLAMATQPSTSAANDDPFPQQPAVQLQDAGGNPVSQSGTVVTAAIASGGGTLGGTLTATTDAGGLATFSNLKITGTVGDRTLSFSASGLTGTTSGTITVTVGAASKLGVTTQPATSARNDSPFVVQPVVQVQDISGNAVSQSGVMVTAAIGSGGGTLGGTLTQTTNGSGAATFTDLKITGTVGNRTLSFTGGGLTAAVSNSINIVAGTATQVSYVTQPSTTAQDGVAFPQQPVLLVQDVSGNPVGATGVTAAITGSPAGVSFVGTATATTDGAGHATFTDLGLTGTPGDYTLTFSAGAASSPPSNTITLGSVATHLSITTQPSANAVDKQNFPQQPVIQLRDASNNPVGQANVTITVALVPDPLLCHGTLKGTTTALTNAAGEASFSGLKIDITLPSTCTLRFTSSGLTGVDSNPVTVT